MAVRYRRLDNEKVSGAWYSLLYDIRKYDKVPFNVNEGHRTFARQWQLVRQLGVWSLTNIHGAARPTPWAPHIRTGRFDHAVDFNNAEGVRRAAAKRGVTLTRTVPGEEWHLEANRAELKAYHKKWVRKHQRARRLRLRKKRGK